MSPVAAKLIDGRSNMEKNLYNNIAETIGVAEYIDNKMNKE